MNDGIFGIRLLPWGGSCGWVTIIKGESYRLGKVVHGNVSPIPNRVIMYRERGVWYLHVENTESTYYIGDNAQNAVDAAYSIFMYGDQLIKGMYSELRLHKHVLNCIERSPLLV